MVNGPALSVVIPAYNAARTLPACLQALERQTLPRDGYEVIVVDDGSTDDTQACVRSFAGVRLLVQAHAGAAAARNLGVQHAGCEIILFTDADCVPAFDWAERMLGPFADPDIVGVKGAYAPRQTTLVARFVQFEYEDKYTRMRRARFIDFIDTYAAAYRRADFLANGGFSTAFPIDEDQEFSFRLAQRGYHMVFVPEARVGHLGHAAGLRAYCAKKFAIGYWKVFVAARHPAKLLRDSHTPQVLKLQILLAALGGLALLAAPRWRPARGAAGLAAGLFLVTTTPFTLRALATDRAVALVAPGLLLARALALGAGFAAGLWARRRSRPGPERCDVQ